MSETQAQALRRFRESLAGHALTTSEKAAVLIALDKCADEMERMNTELGRAYRALCAYTHAHKNGRPLNDATVAYHSLTEAAALRFLNHGALDGAEYFIGKPVETLHAALRGDEEPTAG